MSYIENPKMKGSGLIDCIPQTTECPEKCEDCFFQSKRSYLEPLKDNLPNIPTWRDSIGKIAAINRGGNDSSNERAKVEQIAMKFTNFFFNTASPQALDQYPGPVVLTVNPGKMTDTSFHKIGKPPKNLMFVRVRANTWNWKDVTIPVVDYYAPKDVKVILTFMAYYTSKIEQPHNYRWKKRTLNPYWVIEDRIRWMIEDEFRYYPNVYSCGYKGTHDCKSCGNCIREYYRVKEILR